MRASLALLVLAMAACGPADDGSCELDEDCAGADICARNGECLATDAVRAVRLTWTIDGQPASAASCITIPDLYVMFHGLEPGDSFGFAPVPCEAGLFTIDRLPTRFTSVELGDRMRQSSGQTGVMKPILASGEVTFDLVP